MIHTGIRSHPHERDGFIPDLNSDMVAFNEKRNFRCQLDPKMFDAPELISIIRQKGVGRVKGYFWAFMEQGKPELTVITDPILPAQPW